MTPSSKVPSREMCQALWDAGVRLVTERVWQIFADGRESEIAPIPSEYLREREDSRPSRIREGKGWLPAPDLSELLAVIDPSAKNANDIAQDLLAEIESEGVTPTELNRRSKEA